MPSSWINYYQRVSICIDTMIYPPASPIEFACIYLLMLALQFLFQFWCKSVSASKYYSGSFRLICAVEAR